jgi:hypothetical protein
MKPSFRNVQCTGKMKLTAVINKGCFEATKILYYFASLVQILDVCNPKNTDMKIEPAYYKSK